MNGKDVSEPTPIVPDARFAIHVNAAASISPVSIECSRMSSISFTAPASWRR